jgi:hypothetical protein
MAARIIRALSRCDLGPATACGAVLIGRELVGNPAKAGPSSLIMIRLARATGRALRSHRFA